MQDLERKWRGGGGGGGGGVLTGCYSVMVSDSISVVATIYSEFMQTACDDIELINDMCPLPLPPSPVPV